MVLDGLLISVTVTVKVLSLFGFIPGFGVPVVGSICIATVPATKGLHSSGVVYKPKRLIGSTLLSAPFNVAEIQPELILLIA